MLLLFRKYKKNIWNKKLFIYVLEVCIVNAYILFKFYNDDKKIYLYDFRMKIIESLLINSVNIEITKNSNCSNNKNN